MAAKTVTPYSCMWHHWISEFLLSDTNLNISHKQASNNYTGFSLFKMLYMYVDPYFLF